MDEVNSPISTGWSVCGDWVGRKLFTKSQSNIKQTNKSSKKDKHDNVDEMRKTLAILIIGILVARTAEARLGETLKESIQRYGPVDVIGKKADNSFVGLFLSGDYKFVAWFSSKGTVERLVIERRVKQSEVTKKIEAMPLNEKEIETFLIKNSIKDGFEKKEPEIGTLLKKWYMEARSNRIAIVWEGRPYDGGLILFTEDGWNNYLNETKLNDNPELKTKTEKF